MRKTSEDLTTSLMTSYHYYWKAVKKAAESIGIKDFSTHDFRRNFIDEAYTIFGDIRKVKDIVGHRKIEWTLRYLRKKIEEKELVSAIKQLR
jgi:integrase